MPLTYACTCAPLRAALGAFAPALCGQCVTAAARARLGSVGWVSVPVEMYQSFVACGVPHETLRDHTLWVPCWAERLYLALANELVLGNMLERAAGDEVFRDGCLTILASEFLSDEVRDGREVRNRLVSFAHARGVYVPPLPH